MPPTFEDRLTNILSALERIQRATHAMDLAHFTADEMVRGATERFLGIACEAALRLPDNIKQLAPHINWLEMNNFANLLRHAYHSTNAERVWQVVRDDLPPLKSFVEQRIRKGGT